MLELLLKNENLTKSTEVKDKTRARRHLSSLITYLDNADQDTALQQLEMLAVQSVICLSVRSVSERERSK